MLPAQARLLRLQGRRPSPAFPPPILPHTSTSTHHFGSLQPPPQRNARRPRWTLRVCVGRELTSGSADQSFEQRWEDDEDG